MSPDDYFREGQGSLMQCVLTPADPYLPLTNEVIAQKVDAQVTSDVLTCTPGLLESSRARHTGILRFLHYVCSHPRSEAGSGSVIVHANACDTR